MNNSYFDFLKKLYKKINIKKLFSNNKIVLILSIIISFIIWIIIAINDVNSHTLTITDIPLDLKLSDIAIKDGLKIFSGQDIKVKVDVRGNRFALSQITKNDIQVTAQQVGTIISPGNYTLELTAKKINNSSKYEIISEVKPSFITVMVDRYREVEFDIENDIKFTANPNFFVGNILSTAEKVKVSGPETEISKIKKVVAEGEIPGEIDDITTIKCRLSLYDGYGKLIVNEKITTSISEVDITVPVLMKKEIPITVDFDNKPEGLEFPSNIITITPNSLEIVGPKDTVNSFEKIVLAPIDIRKVSTKNSKFELPIIQIPTGCKSLKDIYSAAVSIDLSEYREKRLKLTEFTFINTAKDKNPIVYNDDLDITIMGPANKINHIKPSDVTAKIDLQDKTDGSMELPVIFTINTKDKDIWVIDEYLVNVGIS